MVNHVDRGNIGYLARPPELDCERFKEFSHFDLAPARDRRSSNRGCASGSVPGAEAMASRKGSKIYVERFQLSTSQDRTALSGRRCAIAAARSMMRRVSAVARTRLDGRRTSDRRLRRHDGRRADRAGRLPAPAPSGRSQRGRPRSWRSARSTAAELDDDIAVRAAGSSVRAVVRKAELVDLCVRPSADCALANFSRRWGRAPGRSRRNGCTARNSRRRSRAACGNSPRRRKASSCCASFTPAVPNARSAAVVSVGRAVVDCAPCRRRARRRRWPGSRR